jgi:UDP-2,4-diacetamido-2,4,6-trideoxy-beta-L-altropyranose hydrolase
MRCLVLADALARLQWHSVFVCRDDPYLFSTKVPLSISILKLPGQVSDGFDAGNYDTWLGTTADADAAETRSLLSSQGLHPDAFVIDHYGVDYSWEKLVRTYYPSSIFVALDDLANRMHDCDILLDQNFSSDPSRYQRWIPKQTLTLLGPHYALLRNEFAQARPNALPVANSVSKMLLTLGGADPTGQTLRLCKILRERFAQIKVTIVSGPANPLWPAISEFCGNSQNLSAMRTTQNMSQLLIDTDLVIGAGGTSTWERFCVGAPSLCLAVADNQVEIAKGLHEGKFHFYVGRDSAVSDDAIASALQNLADDYSLRFTYRQNSMALVDGLGADRVATAISGVV